VGVLGGEVLVGVGDQHERLGELLVGEARALDPGALEGAVEAGELVGASHDRSLAHR
jgi:hypothetical protein